MAEGAAPLVEGVLPRVPRRQCDSYNFGRATYLVLSGRAAGFDLYNPADVAKWGRAIEGVPLEDTLAGRVRPRAAAAAAVVAIACIMTLVQVVCSL